MSNLSEQNVSKYNLFKSFSFNRDILSKQVTLRNSTKHNLLQQKQSINKQEQTNNKYKKQQMGIYHQQSQLNENLFQKNNDLLSYPHSRQQSIDRNQNNNNYSKLKQQDQMKQDTNNEYDYPQNNENLTLNHQGMCLSYSRTLSRFKELNLQNFGRVIIKKLIEKQNKTSYLPKYNDNNIKQEQKQQNLNQNNENIMTVNSDIKKEYKINQQCGFEKNNYQNKRRQLELQQFNQNIAVTEILDPSQSKSGYKVYIDQNEQCSTLKTNESVSEYPMNFLYTSKNSINDLISQNKNTSQQQPILERAYKIKKEQRIKSRHVSCGNINQNVNHNNNKVTSNGIDFIMLNSLYQQQRTDDTQNLSTFIPTLTSRRKIAPIKQYMKQKPSSQSNLSPKSAVIPTDYFSKDDKHIQIKQNQTYTRLKKIKSEHQSLHQQTQQSDIINRKESDSLNFTQTLDSRIPLSPKQIITTNNTTTRKKSNSIQLSNNNSNLQQITSRKSSSNFRQSLKENIEKQPSIELEQLEEIQKLLYINPAKTISQSQIMDVILPLFNNELIVKNSLNATPKQKIKQEYQQQQKQLTIKQEKQKQFGKSANSNNRMFTQDQSNEYRNQQSYTTRNDYSTFITNETYGLKTKDANQLFKNLNIGELKRIDANKVFEKHTLNQQVNDFNFNNTITTTFDSQRTHSAKFIFSHQNFKKRQKSQVDKKIFKL